MSSVMLYIDFDDTSVDSNLAIRKLYAKEFKTTLPDELVEWDGGDKLPLAPEGYVERIFREPEMWEYVDFFPGYVDSLKQLKDTGLFTMRVCSIGSQMNIKNKIDFLDKHNMGKYFDDYIMMTKTSDSISMGKDFLVNGLLIDDHYKNLQTIKNPILFKYGKEKCWNQGWNGESVYGWGQPTVDKIIEIAIREINSRNH